MYLVRLSTPAILDLQEIQKYLVDYSEAVARKHIDRLASALSMLGVEPLMWSYFFLTGVPYRAKLFFIGKTSFWIVYQVDEAAQAVDILRIWNSKQNPDDFDF